MIAAKTVRGLDVRGVSWSVAGRRIVDQVTLTVPPGGFVGLIGPNGSGKSSLLRCVYRTLTPEAGRVLVGGDDVWRLSARAVARRVAAVLQETPADFDFTVREMAAMGRSPHQGAFDRDTPEDHLIVAEALARAGVAHLAGRRFRSLSGGEKQRVLLARAVAQRTPVLVLDEPTSHLDIRAQLDLLALVRGLGVTALAALHDLNLAARYCDRLYLLDKGRIVAGGEPADVLTPELIGRVYGVHAEVDRHPATGVLRIFYRDAEEQDHMAAQSTDVTPAWRSESLG